MDVSVRIHEARNDFVHFPVARGGYAHASLGVGERDLDVALVPLVDRHHFGLRQDGNH
jgi:hypothetical protein